MFNRIATGMEKFTEKQQKIIEEAARDHIFDAVIRVTQQGGAVDFTMQQVASESGMAIGSLYHYFKSKEDLLAYVIKRLIDMHRERQNAVAARGQGSVLERLEQLAALGFQFGKDYQILFQLFHRSGLHCRFSEEEKERNINQDVGYIRELMAEGVAQGCLQDIDPLLMARLFFTCMVGFSFIKQVFSDYSPEQISRVLVRLFEA